jgi:hypothetical protein
MKSSAAEEAASVAAASSTGPIDSYMVCMLGAQGVGKAALLSQFRTSECINAYDGGRGKTERKHTREIFTFYIYTIAEFPHLLNWCTYQSASIPSRITSCLLNFRTKKKYNTHIMYTHSFYAPLTYSLFTPMNFRYGYLWDKSNFWGNWGKWGKCGVFVDRKSLNMYEDKFLNDFMRISKNLKIIFVRF